MIMLLEERNAKHRKYYKEHLAYRERRNAYKKKYRMEHPEYHKKYYKEHPEYREKIKDNTKKYRATHPEIKEKRRIRYRKYIKTGKGMEAYKRSSIRRKQEFGYNPLNHPFKNCCSHHIDKINIINIPEELHISIRHRQSNNEQMKLINILAWDFIESQVY